MTMHYELKDKHEFCFKAKIGLTGLIVNSKAKNLNSKARTSGVVPLRHLRHVPPQTVWRLWLIVYRTELKVSLCA